MNLSPYLQDIMRQLETVAEGGDDEARALAERLVVPLEAAMRLAMQDVLAAAAEEITVDLTPGSVEIRLRGRDPEFVVTPPPVGSPEDDVDETEDVGTGGWPRRGASSGEDEGAVSRINLRLPEHLKARIEEAASSEGLSVNSWLVRASTAVLERAAARGRGRRAPHGAQRYTGWAR